MGIVVLVFGLIGVLIGLVIAAASVLVFAIARRRRKRGKIRHFLGQGLLGFGLAFAAALIVSIWAFGAQPPGPPDVNRWLAAAFCLGLSPAGMSLGLLALRPPANAPS